LKIFIYKKTEIVDRCTSFKFIISSKFDLKMSILYRENCGYILFNYMVQIMKIRDLIFMVQIKNTGNLIIQFKLFNIEKKSLLIFLENIKNVKCP